jgi:hypothetical protein
LGCRPVRSPAKRRLASKAPEGCSRPSRPRIRSQHGQSRSGQRACHELLGSRLTIQTGGSTATRTRLRRSQIGPGPRACVRAARHGGPRPTARVPLRT